MRTGDILLIKSRLDLVGWLIRRGTHSQWNHVAWAIDNQTLVELKAKGKRITPLNKYLNRFMYGVKLVRIKYVGVEDFIYCLDIAVNTNHYYSYTSSLVNYICVQTKILKKLPRPTCSGFIATILDKVDFWFLEKKDPNFITPADISKSDKVEDVSCELK